MVDHPDHLPSGCAFAIEHGLMVDETNLLQGQNGKP